MAGLPPTAALSFELREEVAICLGEIAAHHVWADERATAKKLMLEALRLAEGTWAAVSLKKKYLEIQDAVETPPLVEMSHAASPHREIDRRIVIGAGLVAILLAFAVVSRAVLPTIGAAPQRTSGPPASAALWRIRRVGRFMCYRLLGDGIFRRERRCSICLRIGGLIATRTGISQRGMFRMRPRKLRGWFIRSRSLSRM